MDVNGTTLGGVHTELMTANEHGAIDGVMHDDAAKDVGCVYDAF